MFKKRVLQVLLGSLQIGLSIKLEIEETEGYSLILISTAYHTNPIKPYFIDCKSHCKAVNHCDVKVLL